MGLERKLSAYIVLLPIHSFIIILNEIEIELNVLRSRYGLELLTKVTLVFNHINQIS